MYKFRLRIENCLPVSDMYTHYIFLIWEIKFFITFSSPYKQDKKSELTILNGSVLFVCYSLLFR